MLTSIAASPIALCSIALLWLMHLVLINAAFQGGCICDSRSRRYVHGQQVDFAPVTIGSKDIAACARLCTQQDGCNMALVYTKKGEEQDVSTTCHPIKTTWMEPAVLTQPSADIAYIAMFDGTCEGEAETIIAIISFRLTSTTDPRNAVLAASGKCWTDTSDSSWTTATA